MISNPYVKTVSLADLATAYAKTGSYGKAIRLFSKSLEIAKAPHFYGSDVGMGSMDEDLLCKNISLIVAVALKMQNAGLKRWSNEILKSVAEVVSKMRDRGKGCRLLMCIIKMAREHGLRADVSPIVRVAVSMNMDNITPEMLSSLYKELSLYFHSQGDVARFIEFMERAISYAESIRPLKRRDRILLGIARDCIESGIIGCPKIIAEKIRDVPSRNKIICDLSNAVASKGYINYAMELLNRIGDSIGLETRNEYMAYLLGNTLNMLLCSGNSEKARKVYFDILRLLELIKDQYKKALILTILLTYLLQRNKQGGVKENKRVIIVPGMLVRGEMLEAV